MAAEVQISSDMLAMVTVEAGEIALRDDRTGRSWHANLASYEIGRYPVTQQLYQAICGQQPSARADPLAPVDCVSWLDAVRFCNRLSTICGLAVAYQFNPDEDDAASIVDSGGFRLPTEAEWEFACRAGTAAPRYGPIEEIAWYRENSAGRSHPTGRKRANAWGLHDMLGNVWEWCTDLYDPAVYGPYRIFRGGGWADHERGILATNRRRSHPTFAIDDLGFRLARTARAG